MAEGGSGRTRGVRVSAADLLGLLGKAIASGVAASLVLALAALGLSQAAQAATPNDAKSGALLLRTATPGQYAAAPTVSTQVAIVVSGIVARTRVTQVFHNPGAEHAEGVYVFPLPEKSAVDHLWLRIGSRAIEGRIQEKQEARRTYESARREGRKAALVEQQRPNLFTNAVANIGPGESVQVTLEYQQALAWDQGEFRLRFPLAVTQRYVPAPGALPDEPKDREALSAGARLAANGASASDALHEPLLQPAYAAPGSPVNPVEIAVVIDAGTPLARIASSYHEAVIEKAGERRTEITLVKDQESADRDFELVWTPAAGAEPRAALYTESVNGRDYALLMVMPPEPAAAGRAGDSRLPRETILVIDTSGSMSGSPMEQAKAALAVALDTLGAGDRFNVIEFNSRARRLFADALEASAQNLAIAREWVARLRADGGTEMAAALALALPGGETPGLLRQVIFVTDGAVGNEDALFSLIHARLGASRLFTVGIGSAPNGHFMAKAAQFGRGTFTHVGDLREVREKMSRLFAKIEAPVLKDVAIRTAAGESVATFPARVPDLYLGEPVAVAATLEGARGPIVVSGLRGNEPWSVALTPSPGPAANGVGALWARAKIAELMDAMRLGADAEGTRRQVVEVALEHHLVSAFTSLVAVDVTPTAPADAAKTALVNASLPAGLAFERNIPQTDTAATIQVVLGLLALAAAGMVVLIGHAIPARRPA